MKAQVIWLTGLSGAGKSTLAAALAERVCATGIPVEEIDGDELRRLFPKTGFSREARDEHIRRVGYLASRLEAHGVFVIVSLISPYRESRRAARAFCKNFFEVHVATPLAVCEARDTKTLYRRARSGEIAHFTGIGDPYEEPESPDVRVDFTSLSTQAAVEQILAILKRRDSL